MSERNRTPFGKLHQSISQQRPSQAEGPQATGERAALSPTDLTDSVQAEWVMGARGQALEAEENPVLTLTRPLCSSMTTSQGQDSVIVPKSVKWGQGRSQSELSRLKKTVELES